MADSGSGRGRRRQPARAEAAVTTSAKGGGSGPGRARRRRRSRLFFFLSRPRAEPKPTLLPLLSAARGERRPLTAPVLSAQAASLRSAAAIHRKMRSLQSPAFATVTVAGISASQLAEVHNLVQGKWKASSFWSWIVDPLNGECFIKAADVLETEIKPFVESLHNCPKYGLHNPFRSPERFAFLHVHSLFLAIILGNKVMVFVGHMVLACNMKNLEVCQLFYVLILVSKGLSLRNLRGTMLMGMAAQRQSFKFD